MLNLILQWLRAQVKTAFLGGIQDAVAELERGGVADEAPALESFRARFAIEEKSKKQR